MIADYFYPELVTFVFVAIIPLSLVILTKGRIPKDRGLWLILIGTAWISLGVLFDGSSTFHVELRSFPSGAAIK